MAKKPARKTMKKTATKKSAKKAMPMKKATPAAVVIAKAKAASKPRNGRTLSYTQSEFIENIRAFCGLPKRSQAKELCADIASFITDSLKRGYKIPLLGLGKLYVRETQARMGRNPATGEIIQIPRKKRVRFSVAKALREQVLR